MRILLTNDDGIHAPGLAVLEEIARALSDDIWIVRAGRGAIGRRPFADAHPPVRLRQHGERRFSVTGTPTDAVMMALRKLMDDASPT